MKKNIRILIFLWLISILTKGYSQNDKITVLHDSVRKTFFRNPKKAQLFARQILYLARKNKDYKTQSKAYTYMADLCGIFSQKDSGIYYYNQSIKIATIIKDKELILKNKILKSYFLCNIMSDFDGALNGYNECLELAKKNNDTESYEYILLRRGDIYYETGKYELAIKIYKRGLKKQIKYSNTYLGVQLFLAKCYFKLNKVDSTQVFINEGIKISKKNHSQIHEIFFRNELGLLYIQKKEYPKAYIVFYEALELAHKVDVPEYICMILISQSKLYTLKKEPQKAIMILETMLKKQEIPISKSKQVEIDYLLAQNYKSVNNFEKSNFHFQKYIEDEKELGQKKIETVDHLHDIVVTEIQNNNSVLLQQKWVIIICLFIAIIMLGIFNYKRLKNRQKQFDLLMQKIKEYEEQQIKTNNINKNEIDTTILKDFNDYNFDDLPFQDDDILEEKDGPIYIFDKNLAQNQDEFNPNPFIIKDEIVLEILNKLIKLENKKYFLKKECTLHNVAKKLKTNTAYLSKIINNELGKNFTTYINELRISYVIVALKNNPKLRSYSVNAIASEIGYKQPHAFVKYFKEATGITPAVYIKKINKL